jgi:hypothetical protein
METTGARTQVPAAFDRYYPGGRVGLRLVPMPDYGCIYVKNAKAATSSVLLWLHRIHTGDPDAAVRNIHANHKLPRVEDVGWETVGRMLSGEAFRFSFVRQPVPRLESAYADKIVRHTSNHWRTGIRRTLGLPKDDEAPITFDQFVAALEAQEPIAMDSHWRPQHLNLMQPLVSYDLVGRLEAFGADLARIREATGLPDMAVPVINTTKREGSLLDGKPDLRRRVEQIYAADFELYGY